MPRRNEPNRKANIWVARVIPLLLIALIGYASWVVTKLICVDYLIRPTFSLTSRSQIGAAIAIIVVLYITLLLMVVAYARLLYTVTKRPGLVPRGQQFFIERARKREEKRRATSGTRSRSRPHGRKRSNETGEHSSDEEEKAHTSRAQDMTSPLTTAQLQVLAEKEAKLPFSVADFWKRDHFLCNHDGRPSFCSTCYTYKPDRSHHCSELNRCVMKMDHFCPWVSGVVSETSFKFFIQFTFYAALFCTHVLIVTSYFFAQRRSRESGFLDVNWVVIIAVSGLFWMFSAGMCASSLQFAFCNTTTIENLSRKSKVWYIAAYVPPAVFDEAQRKGIDLRFIAYPRPQEEQVQLLQNVGVPSSDTDSSTIANNASQQASAEPETPQRMFAILETEPGQNPFDIGYLNNYKEIMGYTIWERLTPIRPSPCVAHDNPQSLYKFGPVVEELKRKTGLSSWTDPADIPKEHRHRKRRPRRTRPDEEHGQAEGS